MSRPAGAHVVRLDATHADLEEPAEVARQLPEPADLAPGTVVVVERVGTERRGLLGRLLGDRKVVVARSVRCTALLARGYVDVAAEGDDARGTAPAPPKVR